MTPSLCAPQAALSPGASPPPSAAPSSPPSAPSGPPSPSDTDVDSPLDPDTPFDWPLGRGRVSYTLDGPTSVAAMETPLLAASPREPVLCHVLPVARGTPHAWLAVDLGTRRRVGAVRVQALEAWDEAGEPIYGVLVRLQVGVDG